MVRVELDFYICNSCAEGSLLPQPLPPDEVPEEEEVVQEGPVLSENEILFNKAKDDFNADYPLVMFVFAGEEATISIPFTSDPLNAPFKITKNFGQAHFATFDRNNGEIIISPGSEGQLGTYQLTLTLQSSFETYTKTL